MTKVKLTYFKESGKYYSDGEYETDLQEWHDVIKDIKIKQEEGNLPGLVEGGGQEFMILVNTEGIGTADVPHIIHPIPPENRRY